ncbi:hypothetical protein HYFRA_00006074 [Hymenoscyphus fraxineus]|uniref:Uncharacterized protein n=1 Tax=Hymenoscyphus fraxineus TaxID=746836 RepID=A0A9N9KVC5_9HELO|nr:hypothetical protein HYFRA_00006074 [Hymenoscyphus fraxineus]
MSDYYWLESNILRLKIDVSHFDLSQFTSVIWGSVALGQSKPRIFVMVGTVYLYRQALLTYNRSTTTMKLHRENHETELMKMDASPPYTQPLLESPRRPENERLNNPLTQQQQSLQPINSTQASINTPTIFPPIFGLYGAHGVYGDLCIATSKAACETAPLFYISMHDTHPDVILHSRNIESSPPMATGVISKMWNAFSRSFEITIYLPSGQAIPTKLIKKSLHPSKWTYYFTIPLATGNSETFEWRQSEGVEVRSLNSATYGRKLVRCNTDQVVAAWARPRHGDRKKGKLAFLGSNGDPRLELGIVFEIATVITICVLVGQGRR